MVQSNELLEVVQPVTPVQALVDAFLADKAQIDRLLRPMIEGVAFQPAVKPGFQTSEFWLTSLHTIASLVAASGAIPGFTDPTLKVTSLGSAVVSIAMYVWSRVRAKG